MPSPLSGFRSIAEAFRHRNYRSFAIGNAFNFTGTWMQRIAVGWLTWELTGSGTWLGLMAMADLFPTVVLGPIAGAFIDRYDRLTVLKLSHGLATAQSLLLVGLLVFGTINVWLLFGLTALLGAATAFRLAVQLALAPLLVPREALSSAVAFNSMTFNLARFVGPAIAGLIISRWSVTEVIVATAATNIVFLLLIFRVRNLADERQAGQRGGVLGDMVEGFRYAAGHAGIAAIFTLLITVSFGGRSINELLPKISDEMLGQGASGFATLVASLGVGAVLVTLWLGGRGHRPGLLRVAILLALLLAGTAIAIPFVRSIWIAVPLMFVFGFASSGIGTSSQTLLQLAVDGKMRGRVISLYGTIFRGGPAVGALIVGYASDFIDIRIPVTVAGSLVILVAVGLWSRRARLAAALEVVYVKPAGARLPLGTKGGD